MMAFTILVLLATSHAGVGDSAIDASDKSSSIANLARPPSGVQSEAEPASISTLIESSSKLSGRRFVIRGEIIGEALRAKSGIWVNVCEEGVPIGVFFPASIARDPGVFKGGNHRRFGEVLRISGTLQRICLDHSGELDFHGETLSLTEPSRERLSELSSREVFYCAALGLLCLVLGTSLFLRSRETGKA